MPLNLCTISGQIQQPDGSAAKNIVVTFDSIRTQVVQGSFTVSPSRITTTTDANGNMAPVTLAQGLIVQVTVGAAAPFTAVVPFLTNVDFSQLATTVLSTLTTTGLLQTLTFDDISQPGLSGTGQAIVYFDQTSHRFAVSENGGAYQNLLRGQVQTSEIADGAVTNPKIAAGTIAADRLAFSAMTTDTNQSVSGIKTLSNNTPIKGLGTDATARNLIFIGADNTTRIGDAVNRIPLRFHSSDRPIVDVAGTNRSIAFIDDLFAYDIAVFAPGTLSVQNTIVRRLIRRSAVFTELAAFAGTGPSGSDITVRVNKNGSPQGTVSIPAGATSGVASVNFSVVAGDRITFDITSVGSINPGSDLSISLLGYA